MKVGDIVTIDGIQYTIWLIESNIYHIRDSSGRGYCGDLYWLQNINGS